jgi:tetratricopeptide (TPR) repeat protein
VKPNICAQGEERRKIGLYNFDTLQCSQQPVGAMLEYDLHDALRHGSENRFSRWLGRQDQSNRIEPECWPAINPRFKIRFDSRVFTIGSCFARNIEYHLAQLGLDIPVYRFFKEDPAYSEFTSDEMNRYTPPSILQELLWTREIIDRDDAVHLADVEPLLFELHNRKVVDLRRVGNRFGLDRTEALAQRQMLYRVFREAFFCDVIVMTLGLIECWWDREQEQYVEFQPGFAKLAAPDRFVFRRLDYPEAYRYVKEALELLNPNGDKRVLLTTSPVPIVRTFMADDVIVANTYSKSVLRAVAGRIREDLDWVDYFPSFESVILTKRPEVWENDLVHVERSFVGRIMARVVESYLDDPSLIVPEAPLDRQLHFIGLVQARQFSEAALLYDRLTSEELTSASIEFRGCALEMLIELGRFDEARAAIDPIADEITDELHIRVLWRFPALYDALDQPHKAEELRNAAYGICARRPSLLANMIGYLQRIGRTKDMSWLIQAADGEGDQKLIVLEKIAQIYRGDNRLDDVERILRQCIKIDPLHEDLTQQLGALLQRRGEWKAMCDLYENYLVLRPDSYLMRRQLASACARDGLWDQAETHLTHLAGAGEADARCYLLLARCDLRSGRLTEAHDHAQAAVDLEPNQENARNFLDLVSRRIAARSPKPRAQAPA